LHFGTNPNEVYEPDNMSEPYFILFFKPETA